MKNQHSETSQKILISLYLFLAITLHWSLAVMQIAFGLVTLFTIILSIQQKKRPFTFHPFFIFVAIYIAFRFLAAFLSPQPSKSISSVINIEWILICCVPVLASNIISENNRRKIIRALIISTTIAAIYGIIQFFGGYDFFRGKMLTEIGHFYRSCGALGFYLTYAGNQMMVFYLALTFFFLESRWKASRWFYVVSILLILASILATFARSTWVALVLVTVIGTFLVHRHLAKTLLFPLILIASILIFSIPELQERILSIFDSNQNQNRLNLFRTAFMMIIDHPLSGIGPGLFRELFPIYKVQGFYDSSAHVHNDHLHIAAINGIPAFLAWISMWGSWFYYAQKHFRDSTLSNHERQLLLAIAFSIASILIAGFFQCYYIDLENNALWMFLVILSLQIFLSSSPPSKN